MTLEENKAVVRRFYEEMHGGNIDLLDELVESEYVLHGWVSSRRETLNEAREGTERQRDAFPDWNITIQEMVAEGDYVATNLTITGTHVGQFGPYAPTGNQVNFNGTFIDRVVDGKIVEMWHRPDFLRMLIQLGAVPEDIMGG